MEIYLVNLSHSMIWFHLNLCVDHNPDIWMDDILYALHRFRIFNILCKLHFIGHRNISQLFFSGILSKKNTILSLCEFSKWRNSYSNVEWSFLDPQGTDTVGPLQCIAKAPHHLIFIIWHLTYVSHTTVVAALKITNKTMKRQIQIFKTEILSGFLNKSMWSKS